jgi:hypothetical protein
MGVTVAFAGSTVRSRSRSGSGAGDGTGAFDGAGSSTGSIVIVRLGSPISTPVSGW